MTREQLEQLSKTELIEIILLPWATILPRQAPDLIGECLPASCEHCGARAPCAALRVFSEHNRAQGRFLDLPRDAALYYARTLDSRGIAPQALAGQGLRSVTTCTAGRLAPGRDS